MHNEKFKSLHLSPNVFTGGSPWYGGYSDAGDLDGDGVPEICVEACQNVFIIKSAGDDSFYVWQILGANDTEPCVRVTSDLDANGLNEVVISGNNQTRINEYESAGVDVLAKAKTSLSLQVYPNPFTDKLVISLTSQKPKSLFLLKIYDVSGHLVKSLSGSGTVIRSGNDDFNHHLPPGVYFVRFETPQTIITREVVKIR
ncbi:hypothetical protein BXT86_00925 [candidate division WOR-3 bacterium 4484_100]|uniref:Secretion system C-terminal sorting domain-containing protein n=1 Tax=candidate division WOR-3 bacterium 4484_100 TaxID=1936077 RepID=A0A1V4QI27_UNCW3|nr:MAG: hypothetical protein BXT86_00925 [candidate division WOR-3 bacterium 4484_100]